MNKYEILTRQIMASEVAQKQLDFVAIFELSEEAKIHLLKVQEELLAMVIQLYEDRAKLSA